MPVVDDDIDSTCPACGLPALLPHALPSGSIVLLCRTCGQIVA